MSDLVCKIIEKHKADREVIKEMKKRQAEELRVIEEFQKRREDALLEKAGIEAFEYFTDLYVNGRDGKAEKKKEEADISLNQSKIEAWLLKMLKGVGEGIKTSSGTVYLTRKESVNCADFEMFVSQNMVKSAVEALMAKEDWTADEVAETIMQNIHLELLTKAVNKTAVLELMGDAQKDGSRPNVPPAGVNYVAIQTVGVRKK